MGFGAALLLLLVAFKLLGVITLSWWWVLSPIWFEIVLAFVITVVYLRLTKRKQVSFEESIKIAQAKIEYDRVHEALKKGSSANQS